MTNQTYSVLENIRILEYVNGELIVIECSETSWRACCGCYYFNTCIFKDLNRTGIIPNMCDDFKDLQEAVKKYKIKFLMELKNFNKSHEKNV